MKSGQLSLVVQLPLIQTFLDNQNNKFDDVMNVRHHGSCCLLCYECDVTNAEKMLAEVIKHYTSYV